MPAYPLPDDPAEPDWAALHLHGRATSFRQALTLLRQCARVDATVLLCGETGTGKELAARALHYLSARNRGPRRMRPSAARRGPLEWQSQPLERPGPMGGC